jgi:hypothetical protein
MQSKPTKDHGHTAIAPLDAGGKTGGAKSNERRR